jgi:hypothetical protein
MITNEKLRFLNKLNLISTLKLLSSIHKNRKKIKSNALRSHSLGSSTVFITGLIHNFLAFLQRITISQSQTHAQKHARARAHTHTHTHTQDNQKEIER